MWETIKHEWLSLVSVPDAENPYPAHSISHSITYSRGSNPLLTIDTLYSTRSFAEASRAKARAALENGINFLALDLEMAKVPSNILLFPEDAGNFYIFPQVRTWTLGTTHNALGIEASGLDIESVHFEPNCKADDCWIIDIVYTLGAKSINVLYLPKAVSSDALSTDPTYPQAVFDTFSAKNRPCGSETYVPDANGAPDSV